jgi:GTP cyclohydrolase IA
MAGQHTHQAQETLGLGRLEHLTVRDGHAPVSPSALDEIADHVRAILALLGEDPLRPGLVDTPHRVARALSDLTSGSFFDLDQVVNGALFEDQSNECIVVRDLEFHSLCEHHLLPFFGRAHVAYRPAGHILGLSKVGRIVAMYAQRLQVQERLTREVAEAIRRATRSSGVGVVIEAEHMCMAMRGLRKPGAVAVTTCAVGDFDDAPHLRLELLDVLPRARHGL